MTSGEGAATLAQRPITTQRAGWDEWHDRRWRFASLALVLLLVTIGGTALVAGAKQSSYGDLVGAVVNGDVQQVEVFGRADDGDRPGGRVVTVRWREVVDHYAEVRVVTGQRDVPSARAGDPVVVDQAPQDFLRGLNPDLMVVEHADARSPSFTIAGWSGPFALWWMSLAAIGAVFVLIVSGPQPWRATRWAWFWLFALASPIGLVAYVVLAGPLAHLRPADPSRRRLTGGWAFLIAWLVLGSMVGRSL